MSTKDRAAATEGMTMESTTSFERHVDETIEKARNVRDSLSGVNRDLHEFEADVLRQRDEALSEQEQYDIEIQDLGFYDLRDELLGNDDDDEEGEGTVKIGDRKPLSAEQAGIIGIDDGVQTVDDSEWRPEAILGRKAKEGGKRIFYKVKWLGKNLVTWEPYDRIDARKMIEEFDERWRRRSFQQSRKLRPAIYTRIRKGKAGRKAAAAGETPDANFDRRRVGQWSCEVEPFIWVPYSPELNETIEAAYLEARPSTRIQVAGAFFDIVFGTTMTQTRAVTGGGTSRRKVQRIVQLSEDEERRLTHDMSVEELRRYIANIVEFTPLHYELLGRLHEMDKVVITTNKSVLDSLHRTTFENILNQIAEGAEFPGFSTECYICLEDYEPSAEIVVLPCGHFFDVKCAEDYLKKYSNVCPVCKAPLS